MQRMWLSFIREMKQKPNHCMTNRNDCLLSIIMHICEREKSTWCTAANSTRKTRRSYRSATITDFVRMKIAHQFVLN